MEEDNKSLSDKLADYHSYTPRCIRCNDNGCPVCDGTVGNPYNPDGY